MKKILLPIDASGVCTKGLELAKDLGLQYGAEITFLHIIELDYNFLWLGYESGMLPEKDQFIKVSNEKIESSKEFFNDTDLVVKTNILWGNPADEILDYAEDENFDLIIMCTHGMSKVKRFLLGSVTNKVLHHTQVPILVVR